MTQTFKVKPFCPRQGAYGEVGVPVVRLFFKGKHYDVTEFPHGRYGVDTHVQSAVEGFYVDVELRKTHWLRGGFPFKTVDVFLRRPLQADRIYVTLRADMQCAAVVFANDLELAPIVPKNTKQQHGEGSRAVPVERCLPIDLNDTTPTSIARLNLERVRNVLANTTKREILGKHLGTTCPYGMSLEEWHEHLSQYNRGIGNPPTPPGPTQETLW